MAAAHEQHVRGWVKHVNGHRHTPSAKRIQRHDLIALGPTMQPVGEHLTHWTSGCVQTVEHGFLDAFF